MFQTVVGLVLNTRIYPDICTIKKMLLIEMATHADDNFKLKESYKTLSEGACVSRHTAIRHIKEMVETGLIESETVFEEYDGDRSRFGCNTYTLSFLTLYNFEGAMQ